MKTVTKPMVKPKATAKPKTVSHKSKKMSKLGLAIKNDVGKGVLELSPDCFADDDVL